MADEKRAGVSIASNVQNLGDLRKLVRLADRLSYPDSAGVESSFGKITFSAWMAQVIVPRARGPRS